MFSSEGSFWAVGSGLHNAGVNDSAAFGKNVGAKLGEEVVRRIGI